MYAGPLFVCQSDYWVPPMFALAAVILGAAYPYLDAKLGVNVCWAEPSVPTVLTSIGYFCAQYWLSGALMGVALGMAWTFVVGIAYRQRAMRSFNGIAACLIFFGMLGA